MTRAEAATYLGQRIGAYLSAVNRTAADSAGNLASVIDDALRALGYTASEIPTAAPTGEDEEEDYRVQLLYRAMTQVVRDMGTLFNLASAGDSLQLRQMRENAEKDLQAARSDVLERFGTLGVAAADTGGLVVTMDLNYLTDDLVLA